MAYAVWPGGVASADRGVAQVAAVGVVGPGGLHREAAGCRRDVACATGAPGGDPGALVGVLLAGVGARGGVGPATGRVLVGDRLGVLVALDHGVAVVGAGGPGVDEVLPATGAHVHDVRHVGEGDVAVGAGRPDVGVAVVVVPRAEGAARGVEAVRVHPRRREDDVLGVAVARRRRVAEVCCGADGFVAELLGRGVG